MGDTQNEGCHFRGPHNKDYSLLWSILGFPHVEKVTNITLSDQASESYTTRSERSHTSRLACQDLIETRRQCLHRPSPACFDSTSILLQQSLGAAMI